MKYPLRSYRTSRRTRRQRSGGASLVELTIAVSMLMLITVAMMGLVLAATRASDRRTLEGSNMGFARAAVDEMLLEMRAADQIFVSRTIGGTTYVTNASNIVFEAPGYDQNSALGILPGIYDVVAYRYNASSKTVIETTLVDTGSRRPARSSFTIARNVQSVTYTYHVREQHVAEGNSSFVTNARANTTPLAYVNGVQVPCSYSTSSRTASLGSNPATGADVQFFYTIDPVADAGQWLAYVNRVDVTMTLSSRDGRDITRTFKLAGNARMRNQRT